MQELINRFEQSLAESGIPIGDAVPLYEAWQTLKAAVLAQQTTNSAIMQCEHTWVPVNDRVFKSGWACSKCHCERTAQ